MKIPILLLLLSTLAVAQAPRPHLVISVSSIQATRYDTDGPFTHVSIDVHFTLTNNGTARVVSEAHLVKQISPVLTRHSLKPMCEAEKDALAYQLINPGSSITDHAAFQNVIIPYVRNAALLFCVAYQGADGRTHFAMKEHIIGAQLKESGEIVTIEDPHAGEDAD